MDASALVLYLAIAGLTAFRHKPWTDEAQAWLLARDNSLGALLFQHLHYEGTPGLWHLLLWVCVRLHLSYVSMHVLSVAACAAAVFVLLRWSPFPPLVRWLIPFSVGIAYQAPVIARSYSLVPLLAFGLCALLSSKQSRPILFALLAGLLANTSLIAFVLALSFVPFYLGHREPRRSRQWAAWLLLAALMCFAVFTALPAPDTVSPSHKMASDSWTNGILARVTGIHAHCPALATDCLPPQTFSAGSCRPPVTSHGQKFPSWMNFVSLAFFPISGSNVLAAAFYLIFFAWLWRRRVLVAAVPLLVVLFGAKLLPFSEHHMLVLWTAILASLWLAYSLKPVGRTVLDRVFTGILLVVLVQQMAWTAFAVSYDEFKDFDGSVAAARYIGAHTQGKTWEGVNYHVVGVLPYVDRNIFTNRPTAYWMWRCTGNSNARLSEALARHPDYVLDGESYDGNVSWRNQIAEEKPAWRRNDEDGIVNALFQNGYRPTQRFCGRQPMHFGFSEQTCEVVYEPIVQTREK